MLMGIMKAKLFPDVTSGFIARFLRHAIAFQDNSIHGVCPPLPTSISPASGKLSSAFDRPRFERQQTAPSSAWDRSSEQFHFGRRGNDRFPIQSPQPENRIAMVISDVTFGLNDDDRDFRALLVMPDRILRDSDLIRLCWNVIIRSLAKNRVIAIYIADSRGATRQKSHVRERRPLDGRRWRRAIFSAEPFSDHRSTLNRGTNVRKRERDRGFRSTESGATADRRLRKRLPAEPNRERSQRCLRQRICMKIASALRAPSAKLL